MTEPKRIFDEYLTTITGTLLTITGLLTTIGDLNVKLREFIQTLPFIEKVPSLILDAIPVTLLIVGILVLLNGLARHSRLLRPEALLLRADKMEHLAGRSEDIDRLSKLCTDYAQIHLVGESGAGKSALVRAGLCPELKIHARLTPIYMDVWGQDWETGPYAALAGAFWETLSEKDQNSIGLTEPPKSEDLVEIIRLSKVKLGREPLLIFDQFDDYQTRHISRFLHSRRHTWLPVNKLIKANSFWHDISNLVVDESVHCLFVTRTDTADGLESIRFVPPEVYRLDRLNVNSVQPLLTRLTSDKEDSDPVVYAPEHGWDRLKDRLARDLGKDGAVLPAQMKIAFQGLAGLKALTIRDYERKGGLRGLEAVHIQRHVNGTARISDLTKSQVRTFLLSMVDPETLKTIPKSADDLQGILISGDKCDSERIKQAVQVALNYLEQREIIRKRLDPDTHQHVWILDHDYLCRGVLEAEQKASRWFIMAQESHKAFQEAGRSIWHKWKSLMNPWHQIVLACLRIVGRFHYGDLRSFAALSLFRFAPFLILICVGFFYFTDITDIRIQRAWKTIIEAQGKPGDLGRKSALQYLNRKKKSLNKIDISRADLSEIDLFRADLQYSSLAGTDLSKANLSQARLDYANLSGKADFYKADLTDANLPRADLSGSIFRKAHLDRADLCDAILCGVDLTDANLTGAKLIHAKIINEADLTDVNLPGANLFAADLTGAKLYNANLSNAIIKEAKLQKAWLKNAYLSEAVLTDTNLTNANLTKAQLLKADLTGADFTEANLTDANLAEADLNRAQLFKADLSGADLRNANLLYIRLWRNIRSIKGAKIGGVKNPPDGFLEWAIEQGAISNKNTE